MRRIWVFGGTSSGKTTFSGKLAKNMGLPYYSTDMMKYNGDFTKKYSDETRFKKVNELAAKDRWVCEGTNLSEWVWPAFRKSDYVIILKTNPFVRLKRLFKREIKDRKRKLGFGKRISLTYHVLSYNFIQYNRHRNLARKFSKPIKVLKTNKQMETFLELVK